MHHKLNRKTRPPAPAVVVVALPYSTKGRWWRADCPFCNSYHIHGDLPSDTYSKREAGCHGGAYWLRQRP